MKPSLIATGAVALMLGTLFSTAREPLDGVAAVVNKNVITFAQVRELTADAEAQGLRELSGAALQSKVKEIRLQALGDLIERKRVEQEARK